MATELIEVDVRCGMLVRRTFVRWLRANGYPYRIAHPWARYSTITILCPSNVDELRLQLYVTATHS